MKIKNRNLYIGIITILLCLCLSACSSGTKNTKTTESNVKTNTDISKSDGNTSTTKSDVSTKNSSTGTSTKKSDACTEKSSTSKKKSKTSSDMEIVNENNDEGLAVKTVKLFSEYEGITPYDTGEINGVYIEQFKISLKDTKGYMNYLKKRGYTLDATNNRENSYLFKGYNELKNDSIVIEKDGVFVDFAYGSSVRLYGINMTVSDWINGSTNGGYVQSNGNNTPSTRQSIQCSICHGMGTVVCRGCNGLGYIPSIKHSADYGAGSSVYEVKNHCYSCNGKGQSMCTHCGGTGIIQ